MRAVRVLLGRTGDSQHNQVRNSPESSVGGLEEERSRGVLFRSIPRSDDEKETGTDGGFKETLEESEDGQLGKVVGRSDSEDETTPCNLIR